MKPIFCIDVTQNRKNDQITGAEFISSTASSASIASFEEQKSEIERISEKGEFPKWVMAVAFILYVYGLIAIMATFRAGFEIAFKNAPWLIISGAISLAVAGIFHLISKKKRENVSVENNLSHKYQSIENQMENMFFELGVPSDAKDVDVLAFCYKLKKGNPKATIVPSFSRIMTPFNNISLKMYVKDGSLCLADNESVFSFKLYELRSIKKVSKRISVPNWNKEEMHNKGIYKKYKITLDGRYGLLYFKPYYILEIERMGEKYGLYFPCYELPIFEELTGIKADPKAIKSTL